MALRIIFMGTPDFALPSLNKIVEQGHEVVGVYSQPPKPAGRGKALTNPPVHQRAKELGIEVFTPKNFKNPQDIEQFIALKADVAIVVAYGLLLPKEILDTPKYGCLNLHGSLLPRWRGAAPIQRAIMAGDRKTGVMVMRMDEGLDTGDIALVQEINITKEMVAGDLHDKMSNIGAELLCNALSLLERGELNFSAQSNKGVTYAKKIQKQETKINWQQNSEQVLNNIRAFSPFPGAWFEVEINGKPVRIKILQAKETKGNKYAKAGEILDNRLTIACGEGAISPILLQRAGKKSLYIDDFLRGLGNLTGKLLC